MLIDLRCFVFVMLMCCGNNTFKIFQLKVSYITVESDNLSFEGGGYCINTNSTFQFCKNNKVVEM